LAPNHPSAHHRDAVGQTHPCASAHGPNSWWSSDVTPFPPTTYISARWRIPRLCPHLHHARGPLATPALVSPMTLPSRLSPHWLFPARASASTPHVRTSATAAHRRLCGRGCRGPSLSLQAQALSAPPRMASRMHMRRPDSSNSSQVELPLARPLSPCSSRPRRRRRRRRPLRHAASSRAAHARVEPWAHNLLRYTLLGGEHRRLLPVVPKVRAHRNSGYRNIVTTRRCFHLLLISLVIFLARLRLEAPVTIHAAGGRTSKVVN
jgi:hypothetical protein